MERGNLGVDANGEVTSGWNHEGESTDATPRGGLPRSSDEAEQYPWSEGGRLSRRDLKMGQLATGGARWLRRRAAALYRMARAV